MYCLTHNYYPVGYGLREEDVTTKCIFVSCLPPELSDDWIDTVSQPPDEELEVMNQNAKILLDDFLSV